MYIWIHVNVRTYARTYKRRMPSFVLTYACAHLFRVGQRADGVIRARFEPKSALSRRDWREWWLTNNRAHAQMHTRIQSHFWMTASETIVFWLHSHRGTHMRAQACVYAYVCILRVILLVTSPCLIFGLCMHNCLLICVPCTHAYGNVSPKRAWCNSTVMRVSHKVSSAKYACFHSCMHAYVYTLCLYTYVHCVCIYIYTCTYGAYT